MILAIRTDKPEAELMLWDGERQIGQHTWHAHRQLAETLTAEIEALLAKYQYELSDITGVAVYQGPGSFTGLRIGISVANALASGLSVPTYPLDEQTWGKPITTPSQQIVLPEYGSEPHITAPRK